jgi:hypothetical protein
VGASANDLASVNNISTRPIDFVAGAGRIEGAPYGATRLAQLEAYLSRRGITLKVGDDFLDPTKVGGFDAGSGQMLLRSNPTRYEVWHELSHYRQYQRLGRDAYLAQSRVAKEQFVFDLLENSAKRWRSLSFEEQQHAIWYIRWVGGFR